MRTIKDFVEGVMLAAVLLSLPMIILASLLLAR